MSTILEILRALINDVAETEYSDADLTMLILIASINIQQEISFPISYEVNLITKEINPDPSTDNAFCLFAAHKAAITITYTELRTYAKQSFRIKDGPSDVDLKDSYKGLKDLIDLLEKQYDVMKKDYLLEDSSFGYAVITPTTVEYISPNNFS